MRTGVSPNVALSFRCNNFWLTYWTSIIYYLYLLTYVSAFWYLVSQIIKIKKELTNKKVETAESEQDERNKCLDRRKLGSVYICLKMWHSVLMTLHIRQITTKFNVSIEFVPEQGCRYGKGSHQMR